MKDAAPGARPPIGADPHLAVIVPHYNDPARLALCLQALAPQVADLDSAPRGTANSAPAPPDTAAGATRSPSRSPSQSPSRSPAQPLAQSPATPAAPALPAARTLSVEVVVVDNDSPCDLGPLRAAHPFARFARETSKGAAAARNRGVAETRAAHLLFLDSDCIPAPDWLATALRLAGPDRVVGGRIDTFDETPPPRSGPEAFEAVFAFRQRAYVERMGFSVTANMLTTRAVFDATGLMVVGLSEDKDWCQRAAAAGFAPVYADALAVRHPTRADWPALARKWRRLTDESFALHGADRGTGPGARALWGLRAGAVALSALPHGVTLLRAPELGGAGERLRGLATLARLRLARAGWMLRQAVAGG